MQFIVSRFQDLAKCKSCKLKHDINSVICTVKSSKLISRKNIQSLVSDLNFSFSFSALIWTLSRPTDQMIHRPLTIEIWVGPLQKTLISPILVTTFGAMVYSTFPLQSLQPHLHFKISTFSVAHQPMKKLKKSSSRRFRRPPLKMLQLP